VENISITLPVWAITVLVILYCLEKVITLKLWQRFVSIIKRLWILIRYHNDVKYYNECCQREETRRHLARERASKGGKYDKRSLAELIAKSKKENK
jgi:hypothetical protein